MTETKPAAHPIGIGVLRVLRDHTIKVNDCPIERHDLIDADPPTFLAKAQGNQDPIALDPFHGYHEVIT